MSPDNLQHQSAVPASLPAMPAQAAVPAAPTGPAAATPPQGAALPHNSTAPAGAVASVTAQAQQLVVQYQQDPFRLSGALQQLKTAYLADQFHINMNPTDD